MFPVGKLASIEKKKNKDGNGKDSRIVTYVLGGRITHWKEREREREREREAYSEWPKPKRVPFRRFSISRYISDSSIRSATYTLH